MGGMMHVTAIVMQTNRVVHHIEVDRDGYLAWLGTQANNEDRLREYIISVDAWPEQFDHDSTEEAEPWDEELVRATEVNP